MEMEDQMEMECRFGETVTEIESLFMTPGSLIDIGMLILDPSSKTWLKVSSFLSFHLLVHN
jgi:hypothetical protein